MDSNELYNACLKMLEEKFKIKTYSKDKFMYYYNNIYKNNNTPNNNSNKLVLLEIKKNFELNLKKEEINNNNNNDLEFKIKEIEKMRADIINLKSANFENDLENNNNENNIKSLQPIQISNYNQTISHKFKTFIINTFKNNFKITPSINIDNYIIYPCDISIPIEIKNKTPYIILSINDGIKNNNYIYTIKKNLNLYWDIWKPITNDYINISMNNNNWNINLLDNYYNIIDLNEYIVIINDVLEEKLLYSLNINKIELFNINDKIKIIKENGESLENKIIDIINNRILIQKNNINIKDFINSKIINYKYNISLIFKYYSK